MQRGRAVRAAQHGTVDHESGPATTSAIDAQPNIEPNTEWTVELMVAEEQEEAAAVKIQDLQRSNPTSQIIAVGVEAEQATASATTPERDVPTAATLDPALVVGDAARGKAALAENDA